MGIPFDRRTKDETRQSHEAYLVYRNIGSSRSLQQVSNKLSKSMTLMKRWSSRHDWIERTDEYDAHMARVELKAQEEERRNIGRQISRDSEVIQRKVMKRVNKIKEKEMDKLPIDRAVNMFCKAASVQAEVCGLKSQDINVLNATSIEVVLAEKIRLEWEGYKKRK